MFLKLVIGYKSFLLNIKMSSSLYSNILNDASSELNFISDRDYALQSGVQYHELFESLNKH